MGSLHVVTLKAMRFHALVGVLAHEADIPQPIEVDVEVDVRRADLGGGGDEVTDYRALYELTAAVIGEGHIRYLEDLVDRVAERALSLPGVRGARVTVRKPHVALSGPLLHAEVSVRHDAE